MLRLFPLRRSFSLDLAPDDSNSNFLLHSNDDSNMAGGGGGGGSVGASLTAHGLSQHGESLNAHTHIFSPPQLQIATKSSTPSLLASNMTTSVQWHLEDIDDALAADFDGSLSGLGMELGTSSYNMSEALMALPSIPALKGGGVGGLLPQHHLHHPSAAASPHHHHHHLHLLETPLPHHAHLGHPHAHPLNSPNLLLASSLQSNLSNMLRQSEAASAAAAAAAASIPTTVSVSASSSSSSSTEHRGGQHDNTVARQHISGLRDRGSGRCRADDGEANGASTTATTAVTTTTSMVTQGKKNRLTFGSGNDGGSEHDLAHSIKRFCFDRDEQHHDQQQQHHQHPLHNHHNIQVLLPSNLIQQATLSNTSGSSPTGDDGHQCNEECYDVGGSGGGTCSIRHSSSVPDLRTNFGSTTATATAAAAHISSGGQTQSINSAASSPASSTSTSTPNSLFSQMLASAGQFPSSGNLSGAALSSTTRGSIGGGGDVGGGAGNNILLGHDFSTGSSGGGGGSYPLMQKDHNESAKFQYVLGASTSMAIKRTEETMTYLNQGQSYEIKLKKVGDLAEMQGKMLKTIIRVCFHDRRLQYMEKDLMTQWREQRPAERILEIDVPLSYGVHDVLLDGNAINRTEFTWDPTKETGVFIRINCISTEFTPKKHGGEKGVPFRVVIETYLVDEADPAQCLHAASCQVKVFKPKGADRKHKTDREKLNKKPASEQEKFQQSYHCTIFTDCSLDTFRLYHGLTGAMGTNVGGYNNAGAGNAMSVDTPTLSNSSSFDLSGNNNSLVSITKPVAALKPSSSVLLPIAIKSHPKPLSPPSPSPSMEKEASPFKLSSTIFTDDNSFDLNFTNFSQSFFKFQVISSTSSAEDVARWLKEKRFDNCLDTFTNWSGCDLLLLAKEELIQICGLSTGIRLFNALHSRTVKSRLTLYVSLATDDVFRAIYLETLTTSELQSKLITNLLKFKCSSLKRLCLLGPADVKILVTDDVVKNLADETIYSIEFTKDYAGEYIGLMKPLNK